MSHVKINVSKAETVLQHDCVLFVKRKMTSLAERSSDQYERNCLIQMCWSTCTSSLDFQQILLFEFWPFFFIFACFIKRKRKFQLFNSFQKTCKPRVTIVKQRNPTATLTRQTIQWTCLAASGNFEALFWDHGFPICTHSLSLWDCQVCLRICPRKSFLSRSV